MEDELLADVLIVDDKPENLLALEALIRKDDRRIFQAGSADQALSLLLDREFALAILDVQMPHTNGFELAELMRGTERTRHIPIIFVSAAGREFNYAFRGYESGAVDFLHKPLDPHAVRGKVDVFVDLHRQRKQALRQVEALRAARARQDLLLADLKATQAQLQHAVKMRDDFMSMVSHELRTPLGTLGLESQTRKLQIQRGMVPTFERWTAMVERDERQIRSMVRLIDDMLDVSRLRGGTLTLEPAPTELKALLERVLDNMAAQMEMAGTEVVLNAEQPVSGIWDAFRLEQVVVNLLTNAARYGAGKPVEITLRAEADDAVIAVRDQGVGIAPQDQSRIFDQFERVGARNKPAGLGLGLYITSQIVCAHGGKIDVASEPGKGATFTVRLPRTPLQ